MGCKKRLLNVTDPTDLFYFSFSVTDIKLVGLDSLDIEKIKVNSLIGLIVEDLVIGVENLTIVAKTKSLNLCADPIADVISSEDVE